MTVQKFFKNAFSLGVDLRSNEHDDITENGRKVIYAKWGTSGN
jgi:hypothetical protein